MRIKRTQNKSEFVRQFAPGTPARDVVAAAKKKGIKITERYIYVIRSSDKARSRKGGSTRRSARASGTESELRSIIAEIGLAKAREVFTEIERAFAG